MPLSELLKMARGNLEPGQQKPCPADLSSRTENGLVELVWENGQIVMQGQSSRVTRTTNLQSLPSNTPRVRDAGLEHATASRIGKFGVESVLNDISPIVPSGDWDLSQDDDMVPWFSYPTDYALPQDYCSELLPEISGVTANEMPTQNKFISRSSGDQTVSNLPNVGSDLKGSSSISNLLCSWPPQQRQPSDAIGSVFSDVISNTASNHSDAIFGNSIQGRGVVNDSTSMKLVGHKMELPNHNSNLLNFPHFSRPATLVKAHLPSSAGNPASVLSGVEMMENKDKGMHKEIDLHVSSALCAMVNSRPPDAKALKESYLPDCNLHQETSIKNDKPLLLSNAADSRKSFPSSERTVEPVVASSSVGSGNSADRVSCEQTHNSKRKFHDIDESECRSDDFETESVGVKKPTPARIGSGSKRSRAAEVHNLSERRRRDRINEKMRALQELIPNCNKADKASMLDEAIEYLKTLQLQVQIMSMGAGLCMPRMMFPAGMQHMHPAHVPQFSPMGVGMGLGFGMGMLDMRGGSPGCPIFPLPSLQGSHFPIPSPMSGLSNFPRIPGPTIPVYSHPGPNIPVYSHPVQGLPSSLPRAHLVPPTGQPHITSVTGLSPSKTGSQVVPNALANLPPEDPMPNKNSPSMCNADANCSISINQKFNQPEAANRVLDQSIVVQEDKHATDASGPAALNSAPATDISKEAGCD